MISARSFLGIAGAANGGARVDPGLRSAPTSDVAAVPDGLRASLFDGLDLPLVLSPAASRSIATVDDLVRVLRENGAFLGERLRKHGALLLRGLPIRSAEDVEKVVQVFGGRPLDYLGGTTPRTRVHGNVYTSTEITRFYKIKLHNELAFQPIYPDKIFFFCEKAAAHGGETILADCRHILRDIDPAIRAKFESKKVVYARVFQERRAWREWIKKFVLVYFHLTWQQIFATGDRQVAEERCRRLGLPFVWRDNGDLAIRNVAPAVITHPDTGEALWFNHVTSLHFNPETLDWPVYLTRRLLYKEDGLPTNVYYGDGSKIRRSELRTIFDAIERNTIAFPWKDGDLLVIDNRLVAHGRNPYRGKRRVLVTMTSTPPAQP
jgi:alpha-ketoglutarate-dependent taurine dioxygenase